MKLIKEGETIAKARRVFNISRKVIYDWKKLQRET